MLHLNGVVRLSVLVGNLVVATFLTLSPGSGVQEVSSVSQPPVRTVLWLGDDYRPNMPEIQHITKQEKRPSIRKTVPNDSSKRCPQFEALFEQYGLEPVDTFSYIAWRESRCRIKAINAKWNDQGVIIWTLNENGTYDSGLLQINSSWKTATRQVCGGGIDLLLMLDCNLKMGKYLLDNGGLGHWRMG